MWFRLEKSSFESKLENMNLEYNCARLGVGGRQCHSFLHPGSRNDGSDPGPYDLDQATAYPGSEAQCIKRC